MTIPAAAPRSAADPSATHDLPRELGLSDLVLTQILFIVGLPWVGVAAKQGPPHVVFWLIAAALFLAWMLSSLVADQLLRAEVCYAGAAGVLCALLAVAHRRPHTA